MTSRQVSALRVSPAAGSPPRPLIHLACTDPVAERGATRVVAPSAGGYQVGQFGGAAEYHRQDVVAGRPHHQHKRPLVAKVALRSAAQPDPYGCAVMPLILDLCGTCPLVLAVQKSFRAGSWPTLTSQRRFDARASVRGEVSGRGQRQNRIFRARPMAA